MKVDEPQINPSIEKFDYTRITFYPDLKQFKMDILDNDIVSLFTKRVYDIAGVSTSKLNVYLNEQLI